MDARADVHLTRGDIDPNSPAQVERLIVDYEHEAGNTVLNENSGLGNVNSPPSNVRLNLVMDGGDIEAHEGQNLAHAFEEPSDIQMAKNGTNRDHGYTHTRSNFDSIILPVISKEVSPSECPVVPLGGPTSLTNTNDSGAHTFNAYPQEPPLLRTRTVSSGTAPHGEREAGSVDRLNCIQMLHTDLDHMHNASLVCLTDEEESRRDFGYPCEDLPSSLPPSSSPPQLFSSSPYASSQSSVNIEPSKMVLVVEAEGCASSLDYPREEHVVSLAQDESCLEFKKFHSHGIADAATPPETDKHCLQMDPTPCIEGNPEPSGKRTTNQNDPGEPYGSQPAKRLKLDCSLYPPPTPKRATLASQNRQFKKLAAPFRPPSKLPVVTGEVTQITHNKGAETTTSTTPETSRDKIDMKGSTTHLFPLHHKASDTSRSVTQFKSPLVNKILPTDSRTIRLTPVVQALERKLQLLKRAIKVKEDKEEEVLTRLAGKWIETGREVAYDVWDAIKDAGELQGKMTSIRRSYGWESTSDRNMPWGWDTKSGDAGDECCALDPLLAPCGAERPVVEDDDTSCNTLGTMLRQLGIDPEIFGWDDDKETFSD